MRRQLSGLVLAVCTLAPATMCAQATPNPLEPLSFLIGRWRVPPGDSALAKSPALAGIEVLHLEWIVGRSAIRLREMVPTGKPDSAELEGTVYWDPAQERIRLVAVAGRRPDQGRLFIGEFILRADGRVERHYDVYYRNLADTPAESGGGSRRRYREVWERAGPDRLEHTLEWWWEGRWQPYARGRYTLVRAN